MAHLTLHSCVQMQNTLQTHVLITPKPRAAFRQQPDTVKSVSSWSFYNSSVTMGAVATLARQQFWSLLDRVKFLMTFLLG